MSRAPRNLGAAEDGFAMIISMVVATVAILLVTVVLSMGVHLNGATVRDRKFQLALQVAEAGVDRVAADLEQALAAGTTYTNPVGPVDAPGGTFETKVTTIARGYQIDSVGTVQDVKRRIRVQYLPAPLFQYALFSNKSLFVKSTGGIDGDVFGNEDVEIYNGTVVTGNVTSATGKVLFNQNAKAVKDADGEGGNVISGGLNTTSTPRWGVKLDGNALVQGNIQTQVPTSGSPCPDGSDYNVVSSGTIHGKVLTPGSVSGPAPTGGVVYDCTARAGTVGTLPTYTAGYNGTTPISISDFSAMSTLSGKYEVIGSETDSIDLACKTITGELILVTKVVIKKTNTCASTATYSGPSDVTVQIISLNTVKTSQTDPAIDFENKFVMPTPSPAVLIYSTGFCDLKNSVVTVGAVYCNGINIKNDLTIDYDKRIEKILGFGASLYVKSGFRELPSSTPL